MKNCNKSFYIATLGCKINQYETEAIKEAWEKEGYKCEEDLSKAEFFILNSCAVTDRAVQDVRKSVRRAVKINPKIKVIITGCAAEIFEEELKRLPNIYMLVPQREKRALLAPFKKGIKNDFQINKFPRARAVVKIQDGCSHFCSYCIVPFARGKPVSRDPDEILKEIKRLVENGFKEVILSGINLGQFEFKGGDLWDFLVWLEDKLTDAYGLCVRMRLSSLDPGLLTEKALKVLERSKLICRHLHISVQSGSERILRLMNRSHYTPDLIRDFVYSLKEIWNIFGLSGDFLIGFPSETEEDFLKTYLLCKDLPFTHGHVFSFSPRPMTKAYNMKEQVDWKIKKKRNKMLRDLFEKKKKEFLNFLCKKRHILDVIIEDTKHLGGMSEYYVYCVFDRKIEPKWGDRVKAVAKEPVNDELIVEPLYEPS